MPDPIVMLKAIAVAVVTSWAIIWIAGRFAGRIGSRLGSSLGVGLGILAGARMLGLISRIPPQDALDRFLLLLIPAVVLTDSITQDRIRVVLRLIVAACVTPLIVYHTVYVTDLVGPGSRQWSPGLTAVLYTISALALFLAWTAVTRSATQSGRSMAVAVSGIAAGAALTVMLSGYASGGQLGLPLAASAGVLLIVGGRHPNSGLGVVAVGLFGLLVVSRLFAGLTTLNAVLLFSSMLLACLPDLAANLPVRMRPGPRLRTTLRVILPLVTVAGTLFLAQHKFTQDSASQPGEVSADDYR